MSRADEFISAVQGDSGLDAQLRAAATSAEARKIVTDAGFGDVSSADVQAVLAVESDGDELSELQLAAASGAAGLSSGWVDPGFAGLGDPGW
jgi:predicted ribosomally synthesized peptide with nif11-like leader